MLNMSRTQEPNGSPPRRWGTPAPTSCLSPRPRFTPTQVGNTSPPKRPLWSVSVHPHAGGEHDSASFSFCGASGSPPRRWGTRERIKVPAADYRFTPTQVGNTHVFHGFLAGVPVHPHAGGEHHLTLGLTFLWLGSPPRRWGTRDHFLHVINQLRFTPTQVGNTLRK